MSVPPNDLPDALPPAETTGPVEADTSERPAHPETDALLARIDELERRLNASQPKPSGPVVTLAGNPFADVDAAGKIEELGAGPYSDEREREKLLFAHHVQANGGL
jgi:hypothetical protein